MYLAIGSGITALVDCPMQHAIACDLQGRTNTHQALRRCAGDMPVPCRWHAPKPHPMKERYFPAGSTDVTRREGRSLADYYGVYTLIGLQR